MAGRARVSRRSLLKGGIAVGAGLVVGFRLPFLDALLAQTQGPGVFAPNQWLRIDRDGLVTIINSVPEMGQGSMTTMPMIVADELDAEWDRIRIESAPTDPKVYGNPVTGQQSYGGSRGVRDHLEPLRKAGAAARLMLRQAAAQEWGVPLDEVTTEPGVVIHVPTGRRLLYGQLVDKAQALPVPRIRRSRARISSATSARNGRASTSPQKVNGQAVYGIDVSVPGMLVASIEKCPVVAGARSSRSMRPRPRRSRASGTSCRSRVASPWSPTASGSRSRAARPSRSSGTRGRSPAHERGISKEHEAAAGQPGLVARNDGDAAAALAAGGKTFEASTRCPTSSTRAWSR